MDIQKLTKEQAVIISGFTGILCGEFSDFHADVEKRLGRGVQTFEFGFKEFSAEVKRLYEADFIEMGTVSKEEAKAQAVPEGKGRSDFEIIDQTIELVDLIASSNRFQRDKSKPFPFESNNPRNIEWWRLACKIQELLTDTDPDNCDFEEYKAMIEAQEPTND